MKNIKELKTEEQELLDKLDDNRAQQRALSTEEFFKKLGVKMGDTIEWIDSINRSKKTVGVISRISYNYNNTAADYMFVSLFNSDGSIGKRERRVWNSDEKTIKLIKSY